MSGWDRYLDDSVALLGELRASLGATRVELAVAAIVAAFVSGKPLLICGNGGSAADSMHIAAELVGRFHRDRPALRAIALGTDVASLTAWGNDRSFEDVFARQVEAYGEAGGVLLAISTSGRSRNVLAAIEAAKARQMKTIGLTGPAASPLAKAVDIVLDVPSSSTPLIQQAHLCIYHFICAEVEERLFGGKQ